jgi:hypothetical protein
MDPATFEIFEVERYLPELQVALGLSPSIEFAPSNFRPADLYDALLSTPVPTIKSFGEYMKKHVVKKISKALKGLFSVKVDIPSYGLSGENLTLGGDGLEAGGYTERNNQLFPPVIDVDQVQVSVIY